MPSIFFKIFTQNAISTYMKVSIMYIITALFVCVLLNVQAQPVFTIKSGATTYLPASTAFYYEDKTGALSLTKVQKKHFTPNHAHSLNFGYTSSTYWVRLQFRNETNYNDWRLFSSIAYHNYLDFWIKKTGDTWRHVQTGWLYPFASRGNYEHNGFVFPLGLSGGQTCIVYFRLKGYDPLTFPLELLRKDTLSQRLQKENLYYGIYFGILLVMLLYNLFVFVTLRDKTYIYYVLYILCMLIIFSSSTGYLFRYVHPNIPIINLYSARLTMGLIVITTSLFTIYFLEVPKYSTLLYKVFKIDMGLALLAMLLTGTELYSAATNDLLSLHSPLLLIAGMVAWRQGNESARYYVFAWGIFLVAATSITLRNAGVLPINLVTTHAVEVGSAIEIVLLSLALADRYRILRKEKEAATQQALEVQKRATEELEVKVMERTHELSESNVELRQINEELDATLYTVQLQKEEIEEQHQQIQASINYAQRIQKAILPLEERMCQLLPQHFVFYKPRDIVSGDFYWFEAWQHKKFIIVADCTGHGVPGALMTMLGSQALTNIIVHEQIHEPHQILSALGEVLPNLLKSQNTSVHDGMDIAVCVIDEQRKRLHFAGAKSPLVLIQNKEIQLIPGDIFSINSYRKRNHEVMPYTTHTFDISLPTTFYMYSDGFQDQFGGPKGKKFMRAKLRELLLSISEQTMEQQKQSVEKALTQWMKGGTDGKAPYKQIDDILVVGVKV
ncbi:serine/threonine protein kinases [Microscilla marina ATCC 23134]|uniref:Serine/threonine protein kinases n=2 Tax=Microscilla marina TaxID=1027 RepID=A1ZRQ6_MICM2|nr:serine/threonine protein kinases [Microscilla marina ATCC 23134]